MATSDTMKSLSAGLRILRLVELGDHPVPAHSLSKILDMPRSTTYRVLKTLQEHGFIEQTPRGFIPGLYLTQASRSSAEEGLRSAACRDALSAIADTIEETVVLTVVRWPHAYALAAVEGPRAVRWSFTAGTRHPLYAGASAKVLLAFQSDAALNDYQQATRFAATSSHGPQSWDDVRRQVEQIRESGYCISYGEVDEGVAALAVPLRWGSRLVGSVSVVGPEFRFIPTEHISTLCSMVARLERELGGYSGSTRERDEVRG